MIASIDTDSLSSISSSFSAVSDSAFICSDWNTLASVWSCSSRNLISAALRSSASRPLSRRRMKNDSASISHCASSATVIALNTAGSALPDSSQAIASPDRSTVFACAAVTYGSPLPVTGGMSGKGISIFMAGRSSEPYR